MGARGPVPKPSSTRRRTNKPVIPVKTAPRGAKAAAKPEMQSAKKAVEAVAKKAPRKTTKKAAAPVEALEVEVPIVGPHIPDPEWHPVAVRWYESLSASGQSEFYEPSDWATAYLIAESISRDLRPQVVGTTPGGEILRSTIPMKGASLSAYLKAMTDLLVTEGARRRVSVELQKGPKVDPDAERAAATVTDIRSRLVSG